MVVTWERVFDINVEGSWTDVMRLIGQAHVMLHEKGIVRIQTDIRVGSRSDPISCRGRWETLMPLCRTDKKQSFSDKVKAVEDMLARTRDKREARLQGGNDE